MTNEERLAKALETCQRDVLYALADEALERGQERLAEGYRWLADNEKWPVKRDTAEGETWVFWAKTIGASSESLPVDTTLAGNGKFECIKEAALKVGEWLEREGAIKIEPERQGKRLGLNASRDWSGGEFG